MIGTIGEGHIFQGTECPKNCFLTNSHPVRFLKKKQECDESHETKAKALLINSTVLVKDYRVVVKEILKNKLCF
jgi:hypothetical protein